MKNKKQIITTLLSVLLPVLLVSAVAYATTVGNDVSVGNNLTVTGISTLTGTTTLTGALVANGGLNGGLAMTGTVTNGIDLTGATLTQASDNALFSIGSISASKVVALTANYIPLQTYIESQTNPASEVSLIGGYFKVANSTVNQANLQLVGMASRVAMGENALDAYGLQSHLTLSSGAESTGNMTVVSGKTILGGNNTTGIVSAGLFTVEGNFQPNVSYGVWADITEGADVTSIFEGSTNGASTAVAGLTLAGTITNGVSFSGTVTNVLDFANSDGTNGAKASTTDYYVITNSSTSDAVIKIDIGGTSYWIPAYDAASVTNE